MNFFGGVTFRPGRGERGEKEGGKCERKRSFLPFCGFELATVFAFRSKRGGGSFPTPPPPPPNLSVLPFADRRRVGDLVGLATGGTRKNEKETKEKSNPYRVVFSGSGECEEPNLFFFSEKHRRDWGFLPSLDFISFWDWIADPSPINITGVLRRWSRAWLFEMGKSNEGKKGGA